MTSMYDQAGNEQVPRVAGNVGHWPGAERRRHEIDVRVTDEPAPPELDGQAPALTRAPATPHDVMHLDATDRGRLRDLLVARLGIDPNNVSTRAYVARTRRGLILLVTEYEPDPDRPGRFRHVLGMPITHHHVMPVVAGELPAAWVAPRGRTVDLPELTARLGLPGDQQESVAGFVGEPGPWTEPDAVELVKAWRNTGADGVHRGDQR